ncbi:hypothetical protein FHR32_004132 [Streptosporangium album]|uniref:WXG100 family type VII secretion target n=1 Tax=Streptosporangium album TaxID=47479 RepID=A0A7W7RXG0_9ACTN|nr:hypothetical protein [Streptosporangium album]MBB4939827.1 hypothetical protein [Streptosporangium album]
MNDADDGLDIFSPTVGRGISQWNVMSGELERFYAQRMTRITELLAAAPWGGGTEGNAFRQSLMEGGGPNIMLSNGADSVRQIVDAGPRLRRTLENSLGTDVAIAQDLGRGRVLQA